MKYTYGGVDAKHNRVGRLALVEDGSGAQEYFYGKMREVEKIRRTIIIPGVDVATYTTEWKYDSWNRIQEMIYPDGEKIKYYYNLGGQLKKILGQKNYICTYIDEIKYDEYEQRSFIRYGNGTETHYDYDDVNRRLNMMTVSNEKSKAEGAKGTFLNNLYSYDAAGNITGVTNSEALSAGIGGSMSHSYTYDDWYRLKTADGLFKSADDSKSAKYSLLMGYDNLYNITSKKMTMSQTNLQFDGTLSAGHEFSYNYSTDNPMQLASVETKQYNVDRTNMDQNDNFDPEKELAKNLHTQDYEFDDNGNMISVSVAKKEEPKPETENPEDLQTSEDGKDVLKSFLWDEENRLLAVNNNGSVSCYFYDAAGERTVKLTSESEMVHVNGKKVGGNANICKFTAYVSPYFVVSNGGAYTKHIYAASQRIASKLGNEDGFGADPRRVEMAGGKKISDIQKDNIGARYKELGFSYSAPEKEKVEKDSTMDSEEPENLVFFYHPDHLGSTSYVTDADGNIAQHVEYIPYGEVFVEERNNSFSTNFLFNAKELDNETGLYYYGARYLDPTGAMWLSVDPVFHAGTSPYAYCLGNPVKMVDPDGRDEIYCREDGSEISRIEKEEEVRYVLGTNQPTFQMYSEYSPSEKGYSDMMGVGDAMIGEMLIKDICEGNGNPLIPKEYIRDRYFVRAPNQDEFDASMNFIGDDGTGGRADNNNREYSFDLQPFDIKIGSRYVPNGYVAYNTFIGPVGDPSKDETASTESRINHTHPSGVGSKSEKDKWQQAPSATDIKNSNSMIRRVWGMGSKTIYLFNKDGVKATIPFSVYGR